MPEEDGDASGLRKARRVHRASIQLALDDDYLPAEQGDDPIAGDQRRPLDRGIGRDFADQRAAPR